METGFQGVPPPAVARHCIDSQDKDHTLKMNQVIMTARKITTSSGKPKKRKKLNFPENRGIFIILSGKTSEGRNIGKIHERTKSLR